jgi:hypothetical protein
VLPKVNKIFMPNFQMATPAEPAIAVRLVSWGPGRCELKIIDSPYKLKDDIKFSGPWYGGRNKDDRPRWDPVAIAWYVTMHLEKDQTPEQAREIASEWINAKGARLAEQSRSNRSAAQLKRNRAAKPPHE